MKRGSQMLTKMQSKAPHVDRTVQIVNVQGEGAPSENAPCQEQQVSHSRFKVVEPGSYYQNDYMTLWNDSNDPVSAVLQLGGRV